jgi:osmotically-inducible protein OsmY
VTLLAKHRLEGRPYPPIQRLACEFENGALRLRGRLASFYFKQLAQETVTGIDGVLQIVNETEVCV